MEEQAKKFGLEISLEEVVKIENNSNGLHGKTIKTDENTYKASALIIATGSNFKPLQVPGEKDLIGKGVSYCATCDGPFFKGKKVVVVGGGNSAVQEAAFLSKFALEVTLAHRRDRLRATHLLQERIKSNPKIKFKLNSIVEKIHGKDNVESVILKNTVTGEIEEFKTDGVFIFVGQHPNTVFLKDVVKIDETGYILTDENMSTSAEGIFACGDARKKMLRQVVTACGEGALAYFTAEEYVESVKGTSYNSQPSLNK
jgi:thioredoxin reductase (NADPH)